MVDGINEDVGKSCKINNKRGGWDFLDYEDRKILQEINQHM